MRKMKMHERFILSAPILSGKTLAGFISLDSSGMWMVIVFLIFSASSLVVENRAWADIVARVVPEKQRIEIGRENGSFMTMGMLSLYEKQNIRYFSAGVGLDERKAIYPTYSLKCVFVSSPKPYLAHVGVTIRDRMGQVVLTVPSEQVNGPWLFVDLPKGNYSLTAKRVDRREIARKVTVGEGKTTVVQFRWPHS